MGIRRGLRRMVSFLGSIWRTDVMNDRTSTRNPCMIASEFGTVGESDPALIRNLNGAGAFIETRSAFQVGETVQLVFPLHYLDPPIEVTGVVAWVGADGVGVRFNAKSANVLPMQQSRNTAIHSVDKTLINFYDADIIHDSKGGDA